MRFAVYYNLTKTNEFFLILGCYPLSSEHHINSMYLTLIVHNFRVMETFTSGAFLQHTSDRSQN